MFKQLEALSLEAHQGLAIKQGFGYGFARDVVTAPITFGEMLEASRDYPIVFSPPGDDNPGLPNVMLGVSGHNAFVDEAGKWRPGYYVPAHFRRYPFILGRTQEADRMLVMIDRGYPGLVENDRAEGSEPLFTDDGEQGPVTRRAVEFLTDYQEQTRRTYDMVRQLREAELLVPVTLQVTANEETRVLAQGFERIDEGRFNAIGDKLFIQWREQKLLSLIYAHLASLPNTRRLLYAEG